MYIHKPAKIVIDVQLCLLYKRRMLTYIHDVWLLTILQLPSWHSVRKRIRLSSKLESQ